MEQRSLSMNTARGDRRPAKMHGADEATPVALRAPCVAPSAPCILATPECVIVESVGVNNVVALLGVNEVVALET